MRFVLSLMFLLMAAPCLAGKCCRSTEAEKSSPPSLQETAERSLINRTGAAETALPAGSYVVLCPGPFCPQQPPQPQPQPQPSPQVPPFPNPVPDPAPVPDAEAAPPLADLEPQGADYSLATILALAAGAVSAAVGVYKQEKAEAAADEAAAEQAKEGEAE